MSNLFASLNAAGNALDVIQQAMSVTQNNVNNASTPGYARQTAVFESLPFDASGDLTGGVRLGPTQSGRDEYAEQAVRSQVESWGKASQQLPSLQDIEALFDITGDSGVNGALNQMFQSFSAWSADPNGSASRQAVLTAANQVATAFQQTSSQLARVTRSVDGDISTTVDQVNQLASQIRDLNVARRNAGTVDPSLDAKLHNALESLSELVDIAPIFQSDGSVTVLAGGQSPLVIGDKVNALTVGTQATDSPTFTNAPANAAILDSQGNDISGIISGGRLAGLLSVRNQTLPSLQGSPTQAGSLNILAKTLADRVNTVLTSGGGPALFTYDTANGTNVAASLAVSSTVTASALVASDPGPPAAANGIPLRLAGLPNSTDAADQIDGLGLISYFGAIASGVGSAVQQAQDAQDAGAQTLAQARAYRSDQSGVSLDQEALRLLELQRSYQANAKMVTVISELTQTLIDMV